MAGKGPAPKAPDKRVRRNKDVADFKVIEIEPLRQPELASILGEVNPATGEPWSRASIVFWEALGDFPTTAGLTEAQWHLLARTVILDDLVMRGEVKHMQELRLQLAKFFIAPDDVLRGRFQLTQAEEGEDRVRERRGRLGSSARDRRGPLVS